MENWVPIIYFLGVPPGVYQAIIPAFILDWAPRSLKSRVTVRTCAVANVGFSPFEEPRSDGLRRRLQWPMR
jgi:hypothetical protein